MLIPVLLTALAAASVPSPDEPDQDGVVTTAPAANPILDGAVTPVAPPVSGSQEMAPHGLTTDQQIAQWLAARPAPDPAPHDESPVWRDDRMPHGEVSVGVGTSGYRDYAAAVSLPIGEAGRLDISVRQSRNNPYGYGYGYGYGAYDPYFADGGYGFFPAEAAPDAAIDHGRRLSRPDSPSWAGTAPRPQWAAE